MTRTTRFLLACSVAFVLAGCPEDQKCAEGMACGESCCSISEQCFNQTECRTPAECTTDQTRCGVKNCCDNATHECNSGTGECVAKGTDACDPACDNPTIPFCDNGTCKCQGASCGAGMQCNASGVCDPVPASCNPACDQEGALPYCDNGTCKCQGASCGAGMQCNASGVCEPIPGTCNPACDQGGALPYCDNGTCKCQGASCGAGKQCNASGACEPISGSCNPACEQGGALPYCDNGTCKCQGASCGAGMQCNASGACEPISVACNPACDQDGVLPYCDNGTCKCQGASCGAGMQCNASGVCEDIASPVCSPRDSAGCGAGNACYWSSSASDFACGPAGTLPIGDACTSAGECVPGADCFNPGICRSYCSQTNPVDCAAGDTCADMGEGDLGVCVTPVSACDPFNASSCPSGQGCYFDYFEEWDFVCMSAGADPVGTYCYLDEFSCAPGLDCVYEGIEFIWYYGYCQQLCPDGDASSCPGGLATCEPMPEVESPGYCVTCPSEKTCGTICCASHQSCVSGACVNEPCGIDASLGTFTATGVVSDASVNILRYVPVPSADGTPDTLQIEIYDTLATGTYALGVGDEANYATCNKCVRMFSRDSANTVTGGYFATGGTLELTSVNNGISAVLTNATFEQVNIAGDYTSSPHPSGCTTAITSATVSGSVCADASVCGSSCCTATQECNTGVVPNACVEIVTCDPLVPSSCGAGQACYWRAAQSVYQCGTAGNTAVGGTCTSTTFGQCVPEADCVNGACRALCDIASPACTGGMVCVASGRGTPGACVPPPPANDLCAGAIALSPGTPVSGDTTSSMGNYGNPLLSSCNAAAGYDGAGPEVVYSYTPDEDGEFEVAVTPSSSYDVLLWVSTAPCGDANACVNAADARANGGVETVVANGVAGTPYYIYVDSYSATAASRVGTFTIEVSEKGPRTCPDYSSIGSLAGDADYNYYEVGELMATFELNAAPDELSFEFLPGGVFASGYTAGTYQLGTGAESNYGTCNLCATIWNARGEIYFATGGSMTLTSSAGTLSGTLNNVTFTEVTINSSTYVSTPVSGGCTTSVNASFTAPITNW